MVAENHIAGFMEPIARRLEGSCSVRSLGVARTVLTKEPEHYLNFFYLRRSGWGWWAAVTPGKRFRKLKRFARASFQPKSGPVDFLAYAGTSNQLAALRSTVEALQGAGERLLVVAPNTLLSERDQRDSTYGNMRTGREEWWQALLLSALRFPTVLGQAIRVRKGRLGARIIGLSSAHHHLVYFGRLLWQVEPSFVIVSNDHNVENRCLIAVARARNIKTVYLQHASVSAVFPALNFDYAFLDGQAALAVYRQCEQNLSPSDSLRSERHVILSGQKKKLPREKREKTGGAVGLAINSLDSLEEAGRLVRFLSSEDVPLKIRWHPAILRSVRVKYLEDWGRYSVSYSDPGEEDVGQFLEGLVALIAGNSGIHLEASLCGVPSLYFEMGPATEKDYYGFIAQGLVVSCPDLDALSGSIATAFRGGLRVNAEANRHYSATFGTLWEGREGELVGLCLASLLHTNRLPGDLNGHLSDFHEMM